MDTEQRVAKARARDDNALYELIQARKDVLCRTAYSYVNSKEDALDIVSEAVYRAYRVRKLKEPALFNTWLMRIVINCSNDHRKMYGRFVTVETYSEAVGQDSVQDVTFIDVHQALERLDEKCRTVIILKYFQDLTVSQIAEVMDCPQGTIKTYLHRVLRILRLELKEEWLNG